MFSRLLTFTFLILFFSFSLIVKAQEVSDDPDVNQVEAELKKSTPVDKAVQKNKKDSIADEKVETFSDLTKLAPFSEISVIQKRFLPKTGRFQFFGGLSYTTNDPWFWGLGLNLKFGYFFTEALGVEGTYSYLTSTDKDAVKDLNSNNSVATNSLVSPRGYMGADVVWTPIYGKMGLPVRRIVPFDMYFSAGLGSTKTADGQNPATLHLGTGQIYALSKSLGFRWDFSWNRYSATSIDNQTSTFDNLFLTFGVSLFFPEAKYR